MHFHILYSYALYIFTKLQIINIVIILVVHDYITISPVQYFIHLNSCLIYKFGNIA